MVNTLNYVQVFDLIVILCALYNTVNRKTLTLTTANQIVVNGTITVQNKKSTIKILVATETEKFVMIKIKCKRIGAKKKKKDESKRKGNRKRKMSNTRRYTYT